MENTKTTTDSAVKANVSASKSIGIKVAEIITASAPTILNKVIEDLVKVEVEKRAIALLNAINSAVATQRELFKAKPDQQSYDGDGKVIAETFSKAKYDEKKKSEEKLAKIEAAIEKAVAGDFSGVLNLKTE